VGLQGELLNILNHALYKSSLFLLIGWLEKAMGTRDLAAGAGAWVRASRGRRAHRDRRLSMAGLPFLLGFMSKETFYTGGGRRRGGAHLRHGGGGGGEHAGDDLRAEALRRHLLGAGGPARGARLPAHKISPWLLIVPAVLLVPQVVGGVIPQWFLGGVLEPGSEFATGFLGTAIWHHWTSCWR
jgi:NADH:ubiquinone oxidoreductase subunit 5 (subunit L)/multisubunit Na+/H+ antiporter MnhA subunit